MKKDKNWLRKAILKNVREEYFGESIETDKVFELVDQLDEPEITEEQAWNKIAESYPANAKSLAVSFQHFYYEGFAKQTEKPEIQPVACVESERTTQLVEVPRFVAETIEKYKENDNSLGELLSSVEHANIKYYHGMEKYRVDFNDSYPKIVDLCATIARAWLDGYAIEPPKKYRVKISDELYFVRYDELEIVVIRDNAPGFIERSKVFDNKKEAEKIADDVNGYVEELPEDEAMKLIEGWKEDE